MKAMTHPARARRALATTLASLLTASFALGQTTDEALRRLQEENAALRKRLAEIEVRAAPAPAPATTTAPARGATAAPSASAVVSTSTEGVQTLSPFEVRTDK